jgi:hypothetical protein
MARTHVTCHGKTIKILRENLHFLKGLSIVLDLLFAN